MDLLLRKAMWPLVAAMAVVLAFASLNGGNFASPADAVIDTVDVDDERQAVWYSFDGPNGELDCDSNDWDLIAEIEPPDGVYSQGDDEELDEEDVIELEIEGPEDEVWICVRLFNANFDVLEFDSDDVGEWLECVSRFVQEEDDEDFCEDVTGLGTDRLQVDCDDNETCEWFEDDENHSYVAALFSCAEENDGDVAEVTIQHGQDDDAEGEMTTIAEFRIACFGEVDAAEIECHPCTVEIVPALGHTQYSLIFVKLTDEDDNAAAPNRKVQWITDNCELSDDPWAEDKEHEVLDEGEDDLDTFDEIVELFENYEDSPTPEWARKIHKFVDDWADFDWDDIVEEFTFTEEPFDRDDPFEDMDTFSAVILNCGQGHDAEPGTATVTAVIEVEDDPDIVEEIEITVVGPPAGPLVVAADPTSVRCGERVQITVTVKDSEGVPVSDHTLVEAVTNFGGVLGGTGAVAGQQGLVTPVSSTLAETFKGVATFWLLTSETHSGPYEVIVATGGGGAVAGTFDFDEDEDDDELFRRDDDEDTDEDEDEDEVFDLDQDADEIQRLGGLFSTQALTGRVQVTCTIPAPAAPAPAPTVRAPSTGQGIVPPNTGDAGLADTGSSSWMLFVLGGTVAFALAGVAGLKLARR